MTGLFSSAILKRLSTMCLAVFIITSHPAYAEKMNPVMERHLAELLPANAEWALVVVDMETGKNIAALGTSLKDPLVPASLMKLLTTGAVFSHLERGGTILKTVTIVGKKTRKGKVKGKRAVKQVVEIRDRDRVCAMLRDMNVHSRNVTAQNLADFLGEQRFGPPVTRVKGNLAIRRFLNTLDLPADEAVIADGCGLTRKNRVTAKFMARYLYEIAKEPWFDRFRETLPRPGLEGTVKRIGYTDSRFRVKTGHLDDVFALAGYGVDPAGRDFSFAFIVNVRKGRAVDRKHSRGELLRLLAEGTLQQSSMVRQ
jgi:D-alanyl-D-alanine carboxypeptidase